jgi:hypothetical protein
MRLARWRNAARRPPARKRAAQRRKDAQLVGPLDRAERVADREHFFAFVEGAAAHQHGTRALQSVRT